MAESVSTMLRLTLLLLAIGCISGKRFSIMSPNTFHIGMKERVSIAIFDQIQNAVTVKLYLQDYPHRKKTFSQVQGVLAPNLDGGNIFLTVQVNPENLPDSSSVDKQYVYLVAKSDDAHFKFHKEAIILLSYKDGMVFIQTDKPIYTPRQNVKFRVIPVGFDMKPSKQSVTVIVQNPQGVRVEQWKDLDTNTGIISKNLQLGDFVLSGNWTITAVFGHQALHNTSVQFEVREYVLPRFSVKIVAPPYILKTDQTIYINITCRYTYGMPVQAGAKGNTSILGPDGSLIAIDDLRFTVNETTGVGVAKLNVRSIQELPGNLWFPEGSRLKIQVEVRELATSTMATASDMSCVFTSSPYLIQFKNTPKYFKPGLRFVVRVVVTYPNKKPASDVPMLISAKGQENNKEKELKREDRDPNAMDLTDENGEAEFVVDACSNCQLITIQVKTDDPDLAVNQNAEADYVVKPFDAQGGPLIMARQLNPGKVGRKIQCESYRSRNDGEAKLSFAVVSRGRILSHNTTESFDGMFKSWSFRVTRDMSPSARLVSYYIDNTGRVIADSILLSIEDSLPTKVLFPDAFQRQADGGLIQTNERKEIPGTQYTLKIQAPEGTRLGLLSVDQSVYLLRNKNRLTAERIFKEAEDLDLGCGVGGGKNSGDIFKNAGVVLMTNNFVSTDKRVEYGCEDAGAARKKRSVGTLDPTEKLACCKMGREKSQSTCLKRYQGNKKNLKPDCAKQMYNCCKVLYGEKDTGVFARSGFSPVDFGPTDEEILDQTQVRSFFPETWIYDEAVVGRDGLVQMDVTIPDTITTWVTQAVAINNQTGLGLATPFRIVGYREFFITLKLPYSVKRGEQVSLLVTVFNYHDEKMKAKVYLKGNKRFCSIARPADLAKIGEIFVGSHSAESVAVPIVPKEIGEIEIELSAIMQIKVGKSFMNLAADTIRKRLLVVPEGVERRKTQSFILDPNGNLNDNPKQGEGKPTVPPTAAFESKKQIVPNGQLDTIKLPLPKHAIPGSVGAAVYLTGNLLGPVVNTTIEGGLDRFFRQPSGCGEQTMIYLAPNVYVLRYLMNTRQLSGANEQNAYKFIQSGYQRELNYRRNDMSFSAFGNRRPGSTWLTAFVMKTFCQANRFAGVNIDMEMVCQSVAWLIGNQRADGALHEVHAVIHREMVGGVYGSEGDVAMTAFVMTAIAECQCSHVNSGQAIFRAQRYLEVQHVNLQRPYSMALTAYALSLVKSPLKTQANDRLVQHAIYDEAKRARFWNAGGNALNVETAGYALLAQLELGRTGYAGPIVTYLTNERQGGVGFVSTQDTVVALQALAAYSEATAGNSLDLRVKLTAAKDDSWKPPEVHITPDNALLRRDFDATRFLGGDLFVETSGTGVGLLEVEMRYNVPSSREETCRFDVKTQVAEVKEIEKGNLFGPVQKDNNDDQDNESGDRDGRKKKKKKGKGCKKKENKNKKKCQKKKPPKQQPVKSIKLKVCTRYRGAQNTGMAIMDIGILTGFVPNQKSLEELSKLPEVDRHDVTQTNLVIYLEAIPHDLELCIAVKFDREHFVGVVQAVPIKVYDYYEPAESCSVFYGPDKSSPLQMGVCETGSSSCKCTQDVCAQNNPPIGDVDKLNRMACKNYNYVIKGKVLVVDEQNTLLTYVVEVLDILQQGNVDLKVGDRIELKKRGACQSPNLRRNLEYLFMGLDKGGVYKLDQTSFVKEWGKGKADANVLNLFAKQYECRG